MKRCQLYFVILAVMVSALFWGCDSLAELAHGPKPEAEPEQKLNPSSVTYTVTFDINSGSGTTPAAQTAGSGSSITLPPGSGLSRTGYTFGGWNTNSSGTGTNYNAGSSYAVSGNVTLYAKWNVAYTVTFNANGATSGAAPAAQTASSGSTITLPSGSGLTKTGYTFGGWNANTSGTGTDYSAGSFYTVTSNITLYAKWIAAGTATYTVTFNINSGSGTTPSAQTVSSGSSITLPSGSGFSKTGYTFGGWNTNTSGTGTNYNAGFSYTVTGNVTLYAKWDVTCTVTFNANGATSGTAPTAQTAGSGSPITLPSGSGLTKTGYAFSGWNTNTSGTGTNYNADSSYTVTGTVTLYAKWELVTNVPGSTLAAKLSWLQTNAMSNMDYTVDVTANESISPTTLSYSGRTNIGITLRGTGAVRTVSLSSNGAMFTVSSNGVTLVLDNNITLQGRSGNNNAVVSIDAGGTLVMNTGSRITGNTNNDSNYGGGGVNVNGGTFTMNGGTINGNTESGIGGGVHITGSGTFTMNNGIISGNTSNGSNSGGGGVVVRIGTFTMNGGTISGNNTTSGGSGGGGVYVGIATLDSGTGTFTMSGGEISGNTAAYYGGGVYVGNSGTFTMSGTARISGNAAVSPYSGFTGIYGGGVYVRGGTFTKTGGTIYGYSASDTVNSNVTKDNSGTVVNDHGHAVFVYISGNSNRRRETTAGTGVNMNSSVAGTAGGWEN